MRRTATLVGLVVLLLLASAVLVRGEGRAWTLFREGELGERAAVAAQSAESLPAEAAPAASYDLSWWTVDGGGSTFNEGGSYSLGGTAGQPDATAWSGGDYTLAGGFWAGGVLVEHHIYLPLAMRSS